MNKKLCAKRIDTGKWWQFGNLRENSYKNLQVSLRNTPELKELVLQGGEWINFSLFDMDNNNAKPSETSHSKAKPNAYIRDDIDDEMPF